jgi:transcriptional regulator with XRE-family HTH domain
MADNAVGEYLRARREQAQPVDVGIAVNGHRRVPGLRRDELAVRAGISTEYYTRLEQGRDRNPSARVLDAIAGALGLDLEATTHLHELANPAPRQRRIPDSQVRPSVVQLIDSWTATPAFIQGRYFDVLAANRLASALSPLYTPGTNLLRAVLLDPAALGLEAHALVRTAVATLRTAAGGDVDDLRLTELVTEFSAMSDLFHRLWGRHDVRPRPSSGIHHLHHPRFGDLDLRYDKFLVAGTEDQTMVVYQAEPGSRAAEALSLLSQYAGLGASE